MRDLILPNTFLIGVQKAATTSVYHWLAQHPQICAPMAVKDLAFFTREKFYKEKGLEFLSKFYEEEGYQQEPVVLQGSVHYIFFEEALERIRDFNKEARFILILRNPVERALSAYEYARKFNYEDAPIEEAFTKENERLDAAEYRVRSELTYKHHGLYYAQIRTFLKYFSRDQLSIVFYEDVSENPAKVANELFQFLGVDTTFVPAFDSLNTTGEVKYKRLQKIAFGNSSIRNFIVRKVIKRSMSEKNWSKLRWQLIHFNTKKKESNHRSEMNTEIKEELREYFKEDIQGLEQFLKVDLSHWKV